MRTQAGMLSQLVFDSQEFFAGDLCFVKALSASSWNDLGAKLIAPDPASRCSQLSANLGFSEQPSLVRAALPR